MAGKFLTPITYRLEAAVDRVARNFDRRIREIVARSLLSYERTRDVSLVNATETAIAHGVGRKATCLWSPPVGPSSSGRIEQVTDSDHDPNKYIVLKATGYGATITVDVVIF